MKVHVYSNDDGEGVVSMSGMELRDFLSLYGDPINPMEAAPRSYATDKIENLRAYDITSGTFAVARLPGFRGDVVYSPGTGVFELSETGVVSSAFPKVAVLTSGRVRAGSFLIYGDIPAVSWSKITSGKPTTLAGYGITDGVSKTNDTVTNDVRLYTSPRTDNEAATVGYVNESINNAPGLLVGQIVRNMGENAPAGTLECNGEFVRKDMYPFLYEVTGDRFLGTDDPIVDHFKLPDMSIVGTPDGDFGKYYIKH